MKTQVKDRSQEKLVLAEELGLESYVSKKKEQARKIAEEIKRKKAIEELTEMKFKPLDKESFSFFPKWKFDKRMFFRDWGGKFLFILGFSIIALVISSAYVTKEQERICFNIALALESIVITAFFLISLSQCFRKVIISNMRLTNWRDELPYGALLAIKEAKNAGVEPHYYGRDSYFYDNTETGEKELRQRDLFSYKIYYPQVEQERLKADPIITGLYKGVEVVIFAWDDKFIHNME